MKRLRIVRDRLRALVARNAVTDEIQEEIQYHIDRRAADLERQGYSPANARRIAINKFGHPSVIRDRGYDVRGGGFMESVIQDVKYALRLLWKQRGFSAVALTTLALGIGATTAIFCVADAALIRPLPYDKPEQLMSLGIVDPRLPDRTRAASIDDMEHWRSLTHVFSHAGTYTSESRTVVGTGDPENIRVSLVTADYLPMYGITPLIGRAFTGEDEQLTSPPIVLLGYRYWKSAFNGDQSVIGRAIQFASGPATIVGVLADDVSRVQTKIYAPLQATAERRRGRTLSVYARLRDGVTMASAKRETDALFTRLAEESKDYVGFTNRLTPQYERTTRGYRPTVMVLLGAVGFVLLIACVNVGSLQLARGATRHAEMAIRASIGAGRSRLIRQLITESLVLSVVGSLIGLVVAWLVLGTLLTNIPISMPAEVTVGLNARVFAATIALATICGLLFGIAPAFRSSKPDLNNVLGRGARSIRTTVSKAVAGLLISVEIAAAILLVCGAALMLKSFAAINATPLGFDASRFVTMEAAPIDNRPEVVGPYYSALLDRLRHTPGIESAGATNHMPLSGNITFGGLDTSSSRVTFGMQEVTPGYFETLDIPLIEGRYPSGPDVSGESWLVLSSTAAAKLFPGVRATGQRVKYNNTWREVVGVVRDVQMNDVETQQVMPDANLPQVYAGYIPTSGSSSMGGVRPGQSATIVVRSRLSGDALAAVLRDAAKSIGPSIVVQRIRAGSEWWSSSVTTPRQRTVLLGILGGLGLLLALVGVFGVTSFAVSRRIPEIGVRMAFGAQPGQVVRTILKDAAMPIAIGIVAGLVGAFYLSKMIATFLYKTEPRDPWAFAAAAMLLALCGLFAAWIPARRAAKVDPVVALRAE